MSRMIHAPIPMDALRDPDLSATDFRILGAIASHDRLDRNGRGCFASMGTLAREALCGLRSAERSVARLKDRGYVRSERSKTDGRQYVLRLVYPAGGKIPATSGGNITQDTRQIDPKYPPTQFEVYEQNQSLDGGKHNSKHIPGTGEAYAENLVHSASGPQNMPSAGRYLDAPSPEQWLAMVTRELKSRELKEPERLVQIYDDLEAIQDETSHGDRCHGWAHGLQQDVYCELYSLGYGNKLLGLTA